MHEHEWQRIRGLQRQHYGAVRLGHNVELIRAAVLAEVASVEQQDRKQASRMRDWLYSHGLDIYDRTCAICRLPVEPGQHSYRDDRDRVAHADCCERIAENMQAYEHGA